MSSAEATASQPVARTSLVQVIHAEERRHRLQVLQGSLALVALTLIALAGYVFPARKAARLDPLAALRFE